MSSSRARSRVAALFAAIPVVVATAPFLAPSAAAADVAPVRVADLELVDGKPRIGPRAGFRGATQYGVNGSTAMFAVDASPSAAIEKVSLHVDEVGNFSVFDDFDSNDGFALYKDLNDDDHLDANEYAEGPVSQPGYRVTSNGHAVVITITADPAKATGEDSYLIAVHPSSRPAADRTATFTVPVGGVVTSTGTLPTEAVTRDNVIIDSAAPVAIPLTNFAPVNRAPAGDTCPANADCGNDGYRVSLGSKPVESGEQLGFFNNGSDLSDGALLAVPNASPTTGTHPAIYDVAGIPAATPTELSIGNGTGRDASVSGSRALNNQTSDDVWVQQWDILGNTVGQVLSDAVPTGCPAPCTPRGNDVTAPAVSYSVSMSNVTASSSGGEKTAPVTGTVTGPDSTIPAGRAQTPVAQLALPEQVTASGSPVAYTVVKSGDENRSAGTVTPSSSAQSIVTTVNVDDEASFPHSSLLRASARLVDTLGNATPRKQSNVVVKDVIAPNFLSISLIDEDGDGTPDEGEVYRVFFDDPIDTTKVTSGNVNTVLTVKDPNSPQCGTVNDPQTPCKNWGRNPTVSWSADGRILSIELGEHCDQISQTCTALRDLPEPGDLVTAATSVTDPVGNLITNRVEFPIGQPVVLPFTASTVDTTAPTGANHHNTGRDGVLDAVDVEFTGALNGTSVSQASSGEKFTVTLNGQTLPATAALLAGGDTVRVSFTVPEAARSAWGTGAIPVVNLAGGTVQATNGQVIAAFSLTSTDRVAPLPIKASTQDSNADGRIDRVLVKYSEAIRHGAENPCGYTVQGYSSTTYSPTGATTVPSAATCPKRSDEVTATGRNKPSPVPAGATLSDTVSLELKVGSVSDTIAMPAVDFRATNPVPPYGTNTPPACNPSSGSAVNNTSPNCPVVDANGNGLAAFATVALDEAGPAILERTTADINSDGRLDFIAVKYSETVSSSSLGSALFTLSEPNYTITTIGQTSSTDLRIWVENVAPRQGDTGVTPKLTSLGGTTDTRDPGNPTPADAGVVVTDKAGPALRSGCSSSPAGSNGSCPADSATDDKIAVFFSEAVDPSTVLPADFVVEQPAGTAKTVTAHTMNADNKSVVLTLAEGAINKDEDAYVRIAGQGSILDASAAKNPNTQTTNVTVFKAPTATLSLSCTTAGANAGYCGSLKVNTGIIASPAVSLWRLSETARTATPADSEFSSTMPSTYTFETEGAKTLYLTGKDDFGRLTTEDSESVKIVLAPQIKNVQMVISTPRASNAFSTQATVVDGDNVIIGADAVGSDAAEWATAATGGGCKQANMSIDLRGLTKVSTQSAVAPFKCDLRTTTPPYRQMQFPVVKATGTTRYPVGTVLRSSTNPADPGAMVVDGPDGTQLRRHFVSAGARRSHMISDAQVIRVPSAVLLGLKRGSGIGYRDGAIVKTTGTGYYYMYANIKRPVSTTTLAAWKIPTSHAYNLSSAEFKAHGTGVGIGANGPHAVGTWIKFSNGSIQQVLRNAQGVVVRRAVGSTAALPTLVPGTHIYPANAKDSAIPFDTFLRGYRDGTLLKLSGGRYGVVARASLRVFAEESPGTSRTFNTLGYNTTNARSANGAAMPRVQGMTYRTGAEINRYSLSPDVVISVRNTAGTLVTATVPTGSGLFGVGTLDPAPAGWDFTR